MFDVERTFMLSPNAEGRNYVVYFGCRQARDCIKTQQNNTTKTLKLWNDNKATFSDGMYSETGM